MTTELSTLLDLVFIDGMPKEAITKIKERIKDIEQMQTAPAPIQPSINGGFQREARTLQAVIQQAPSTQRLLGQMPADGEEDVPIKAIVKPKRMAGGEVITSTSNTGLSATRGPRKF